MSNTNKTIALADKLALSVGEAGQLVGLAPSSIRRLIAEGVISRVPGTDRVLIARRELERWVNSTSDKDVA